MFSDLKLVQNLKSYARKKKSNLVTFQFSEFFGRNLLRDPKVKRPQNESANSGLSNGIKKTRGPGRRSFLKFSLKYRRSQNQQCTLTFCNNSTNTNPIPKIFQALIQSMRDNITAKNQRNRLHVKLAGSDEVRPLQEGVAQSAPIGSRWFVGMLPC